MPADLQLDPATRDIVVENGDLVLIYDDEALRQRLWLRLTDVLGDWFRDTTHGTDWFGAILGKRSDVVRRTELRRVVLATEGVAGVVRLELDYTNSTRTLAVEMTVLKADGLELDIRFEDVLPWQA